MACLVWDPERVLRVHVGGMVAAWNDGRRDGVLVDFDVARHGHRGERGRAERERLLPPCADRRSALAPP